MNFIKKRAIGVVRGETKSRLPLWFWANILCFKFGKSGIWFWRKGDEILYLYPWERKGKVKFISLLASGTGKFGDASFFSLKELDQFWENCDINPNEHHTDTDTF